MNENAQLLNYIFQNSEMGVTTISQLIDIIEEKEFKEQMRSQLKEYKSIHQKSKELLNENGYDEKGISQFDKIKTYLMINMKTMTDKTNSNISEMMIIGSNMGIIQSTRKINKYESKAEKDILDLMKKLRKFEENNVQELKRFL